MVSVKALLSMKNFLFSVYFHQISLKFLATAFVTLLSIRVNLYSIECYLAVTD